MKIINALKLTALTVLAFISVNSSVATAQDDQTPEFKGVIKLDVRDSTPDWAPFTPKKAPAGAPNFLFVLYDDTGLAAWSTYGGRINMPTLDKLAARGLTYTQWHTTALCSPTRSTLLTGRNHHLNGMAAITEGANGFPGASGRIPDAAANIMDITGSRAMLVSVVALSVGSKAADIKTLRFTARIPRWCRLL